MENKISLPGLAAMLALSTGRQKELCENFLREFFKIIEEELCAGENVRVKGFGSFKLVDVEPRRSVNVSTGEEFEIPGHKKVIFVAANELSSLVNQAFGAFEAVEIDDALPTDILEGELPDDIFVEGLADDIFVDEHPDDMRKEMPAEDAADSVESVSESSEDATSGIEVVSEPEDAQLEEESVQEMAEDSATAEAYAGDEEAYADHEENGKSRHFAKGFVAGILSAVALVAAAFAVAWFSGWLRNDDAPPEAEESVVAETEIADKEAVPDQPEVKDEVFHSDSTKIAAAAEEADTHPSDAPVYDVVTTTRYLTTIAKEHYGNFNLWPIIYEENQSILGHPDRIRPGTKVVVPPLSKYGVDPHNAAHIKEIKRKGTAIYARFK